jgi:hypothetical protein
MIYQYTGQPGHGKTLHAIDKALEWVDEGREVYACNIRKFQAAKAGMIEITPEQFLTWPDWAPHGAAFLVDECYEHKMLPKRAPGSVVPRHVEQLAKHRHSGLDFIFVAQSPTKQMDVFVHDLIERHVHVRRRFGLMFAHLRIFDRFETNPAKSHPLILQRVKLPKRPMGLYESTAQDTTEKKIPWYYFAAVALVLAIAVGSVFVWLHIRRTFSPDALPTAKLAAGDGAPATATAAGLGGGQKNLGTREQYAQLHMPRWPAMPWSAPVYDQRQATADPQLFCASSGAGQDAQGEWSPASCTCITEQATRYVISDVECRRIALEGPVYNPYLRDKPATGADQRADGSRSSVRDPVAAAAAGETGFRGQQARYGQMRSDSIPADYVGGSLQ